MKKKPTVFISYSHSDSQFVDWLADQLKASGVDVWIDKWKIKVGDSIIQKINEGIHASDFLIVVLSRSSINSKWVREELNAATIKNVEAEKHAFVLPVLIEECDIPTLLKHRKYANFKDEPEQAFRDLVEVIRPELSPTLPLPRMLRQVTTLADDQWVAALRGDLGQGKQEAAYRDLAEYLYQVVYNYLRSRSTSVPGLVNMSYEQLAELAEGFTQSTLEKIALKQLYNAYRGEGRFMAYIAVVAISEVKQSLRSG